MATPRNSGLMSGYKYRNRISLGGSH